MTTFAKALRYLDNRGYLFVVAAVIVAAVVFSTTFAVVSTAAVGMLLVEAFR